MATNADVVSVERVIPAPAEQIFTVVADPTRHQEFDGSGTVRDAKHAPNEKLALGSKFGMHMRLGIPYSMESTIIEYEENRRIAWQTRGPGMLGSLVGGRIWRYEFEPVDGGTLVRESWDISEERVKAIVRPIAGKTREAMTKTLERLAAVVAA